MPSFERTDFENLLAQAPEWAKPADPDRLFELLRNDSLSDLQIDELIEAAGVPPEAICEEYWDRLQAQVIDHPPEASSWEVVESLQDCQTLSEALEYLLSLAGSGCLNAIRLYCYVPEDDKLVSIECAGHDETVALRIKLGHIVKFRESSPLALTDSFWSLECKTPVLFAVDESVAMPLKPDPVSGNILFLRIPYGQCEHVLTRHRSALWVDFPLITSGHVVGKLSCDLSAEKPTQDVLDALGDFWRIVQVAAPYLAVLLLNEYRAGTIVVRCAWEEIQQITSLEKLYDYCTSTLPAKLGCQHASLFTVSRDSMHTEKLVLRKTSFESCKSEENVGHYDLFPRSERSLTVWVAQTGRILRLQHLKNEAFFEQQKQAYDKELVWSNKYQDSTGHTSFLAIPIFAPQTHHHLASVAGSGVVGVLRLTEKYGGEEACFTEADERILSEVARKMIGAKLVSLIDKEISDRLLSRVINELVERACDIHQRPSSRNMGRLFKEAFCETMQAIFPEKRFPHLYLLNILGKDKKHFKHFAIGGQLSKELKNPENQLYELESSLTGETLRKDRDFVFLNDLPRAEREGLLVNIAPRARCALAQRLDSGGRSGVIVVQSAGYDIQPETEQRILRLIASHISKLLEETQKIGFDE